MNNHIGPLTHSRLHAEKHLLGAEDAISGGQVGPNTGYVLTDVTSPAAPGAGKVLFYSTSGVPMIRAGAAGAETEISLVGHDHDADYAAAAHSSTHYEDGSDELDRVQTVVKTLTNKSGSTVNNGDVVSLSNSNTESFGTSAALGQQVPFGVALETIANNASGKVALMGYIATLQVSGAVVVGNLLRASGTTGKATVRSGTTTLGIFAMAMSAGTDTTISALLFGYTQGATSFADLISSAHATSHERGGADEVESHLFLRVADAAALAALASPAEGDHAWQDDINTLWVYQGAVWQPVDARETIGVPLGSRLLAPYNFIEGTELKPLANVICYIPFRVNRREAITFIRIGWVSTSSGNIDVGLYDNVVVSGEDRPNTRLVSSGSIACPAAASFRDVAVTSTTFGPGLFWLAIVANNATAGFRRFFDLGITGVSFQTATFPLPATATHGGYSTTAWIALGCFS